MLNPLLIPIFFKSLILMTTDMHNFHVLFTIFILCKMKQLRTMNSFGSRVSNCLYPTKLDMEWKLE